MKKGSKLTLKPYALATTRTVYVSADDPFKGARAVIKKLEGMRIEFAQVAVVAQYIPNNDRGEPAYFAVTATGSV